MTVRWYRSTQEHLARVQGELVTSGYNDNITRNLLPFSSLISSHHNRIIENLNESLNGFYWCQIEVNNTCLQPSPYGRIIFNSSSENNCSSNNTVMHIHVPPLCANKICPVSKTTATPTASCSTSGIATVTQDITVVMFNAASHNCQNHKNQNCHHLHLSSNSVCHNLY